jgi:hypothetical protein
MVAVFLYVLGAVAASCVFGICIGKLMRRCDLERPLAPQRMVAIAKWQDEIAFRAKFGREQ